MIDSVMEFVNETTSNSLFMFLFCNVIIILILMANSKPGSEDKLNPMLKSDSVLSSKPGFGKSHLISDSVIPSKPGFEETVLFSKASLTSEPGLQEPDLISELTLTSKTGLQEPEIVSKLGLLVMSGSDILEKDEKGRESKPEMKEESLEVENESEIECMLRRRVEEFILKVNTQWKSENTDNTNYLRY
ncbi:unnamed protein product [Cochlearia groenlandica]